MRLWLLLPREDLAPKDDPWEPWFDKAFGFVVRAETEEEARRMANDQGGCETGPVRHSIYRTGGDPWLDPAFSTCRELSPEGDAGVILRDMSDA